MTGTGRRAPDRQRCALPTNAKPRRRVRRGHSYDETVSTASRPLTSDRTVTRIRDAVWNPTAVSMRLLALAMVVVNAGIVVTGGAVRLTKSGLGCPEWPKCTGDSLVPTAAPEHSPVNMAIEFGNRMLSFLVLATAIACVVAAWRLRPQRRGLRLLAAVQPLGVVAQAVWGGLLVWIKLHPAMVGVHYLLSAGLIAAAVTLFVRASEGDEPPRGQLDRRLRWLAAMTVGAVAVVLVAGTVVTGTGPHAGDDQAPRYDFDIVTVTRLHSTVVWISVGLTVAVLVVAAMTGAPSRFTRLAGVLLGVELAQGAVGYAQYLLGVPAPLVGLHLLGSVLTWIVAVHMMLATRTRGPRPDRRPAPAARQPTGTP